MRRWRVGRMKQIIRELKRLVAGEKLEPEQLKGLIRAGYVYRNGDEHLLTGMGRDALAQPAFTRAGSRLASKSWGPSGTLGSNRGGTANHPRAVRRRDVGVPAFPVPAFPTWLAERPS